MTIVKPLALSACFVVMLCAGIAPEAPLKLGFVREVIAGLVVAPVRRIAVVTTAVARLVVGECERAARERQCRCGKCKRRRRSIQATASRCRARGSSASGDDRHGAAPGMRASLSSTTSITMRCGSTYYKASMMGSNLVFVVSQP